MLGANAGMQALHPGVGGAGGQDEPAYVELWPQQWRFFSDFADADLITGYTVEGTAISPVQLKSASAADLWGLRISADSLSADLAYLAGSVPTAAWTTCSATSTQACVARALAGRPVALVDRYPRTLMCGTRLLAVEGPEQAHGGDGLSRAAKEVVRINVTCPKN